MNVVSLERELKIREGIANGWSIRQIADYAGVNRGTVNRRKRQLEPIPDLHDPVKSQNGCHYCGKKIEGKKEFHKRSSRTKHMFCDHDCYQNYYLVTNPSRLVRYLKEKTSEVPYGHGS